MVLFAKGLLFGFLLAATVGPMWVLCFRRTIAHGALAGLASGMGIAVADGLYGAVAAAGSWPRFCGRVFGDMYIHPAT